MKARKVLKSKEVELNEYLQDMKILNEDEVLKETDEAVEMLVQVETDLEAVSVYLYFLCLLSSSGWMFGPVCSCKERNDIVTMCGKWC
jgi:hypothetical protein